MICRLCLEDLSNAVNFRNKVRKSDEFFRKSTKSQIWEPEKSSTVKQENSLDEEKIKDEPEDFHVDLFENIDTILEENIGLVEESNAFAGMINNSKHQEQSVDSSESLDEFEEYRKRKKLKNSRKRLLELE